ncbi:hypothetical protein NGC52_21065 [Klebsiella michiganensis]|uniref:hypothetical protein n=1 Tax=Klebsiella TaxID=570 RepID=UPI0012B81B1D|nr:MULTISPECIES: hypothetical protein [Klebsiella]MBR7642065.1 hypothetical protein [Klebsiella michiganensis]MEB7682222.1 hypothetical protein [Klebsiella michiganensis]QLO23376.1 hypothetical protein HV187_04630 [Klebsiella michiganensis]QLO57910.1 hypothetical protein HV239_10730 [Klebsiella pneumoniae]HCT3398843.1 hypothetical protein [Klebsiella michiganensis]
MHKTTAVIDSPEALGLALCRHVPDMANGFTITTRDSQLQLTVTAEDTRPFMVAMERLLKGKIRQIQRGHLERVLDERWAQIEENHRQFAEQVKSNGKNLAFTSSSSEQYGQKLTAAEIAEKYCNYRPDQQQSAPQKRDYATQLMSAEELNTLLDRALEQGMPEQMLAPFRNGVKTQEQARRLELSYHAWVAVESIRDFHRQRSRRDDQKETSEVSGQDAGSPGCSQQDPVQPEAGGQEPNDSPSPSDKGPGTRQSPGDQTNSL